MASRDEDEADEAVRMSEDPLDEAATLEDAAADAAALDGDAAHDVEEAPEDEDEAPPPPPPEPTEEEKLQLSIAQHFLLSAPPGEFREVLADVSPLAPPDLLTPGLVAGVARARNLARLEVATAPDGSRVVVCAQAEDGPTRYRDPAGRAYDVDHVALTATPRPVPLAPAAADEPADATPARDAVAAALAAYAYPNRGLGIVKNPSSGDGTGLSPSFVARKVRGGPLRRRGGRGRLRRRRRRAVLRDPRRPPEPPQLLRGRLDVALDRGAPRRGLRGLGLDRRGRALLRGRQRPARDVEGRRRGHGGRRGGRRRPRRGGRVRGPRRPRGHVREHGHGDVQGHAPRHAGHARKDEVVRPRARAQQEPPQVRRVLTAK
mmetsp:Transcript_30913/g.92665  ORF Transcript_30913/g.92665 Transcript_30913/m.92665 type:complete len:376 (-) Transcript_30913:29-1156(-)